MEEDKAEICKRCANGQVVLNFNPSNGCPDSEDVGEGWNPDNPQIGFSSVDRARDRTNEKIARTAMENEYHESVPCIFCGNCVIVREMREGHLCNVAYFCRYLRRKVSKIGTCRLGKESKYGPLIIKKDATVAEALTAESKAKLVN